MEKGCYFIIKFTNLEERGLRWIKPSVAWWDDDINWSNQTNTSRGSNLQCLENIGTKENELSPKTSPKHM